MNLIVRWLVFFLSIALVGCSSISKSSFIQNRDKTYLTARSIPPLKIPPGIASNALQNSFPVSDRQYPESAKNVSVVPPGLG